MRTKPSFVYHQQICTGLVQLEVKVAVNDFAKISLVVGETYIFFP